MAKLKTLPLRALVVMAAFVIGPTAGMAYGAGSSTVHKIGAVTWHAARFVNQDLVLTGYMLQRGDGYVLFSDEPNGAISAHDLPVTGVGLDLLLPKVKYILHGHFERGVRPTNNGNAYRFVLSSVPEKTN